MNNIAYFITKINCGAWLWWLSTWFASSSVSHNSTSRFFRRKYLVLNIRFSCLLQHELTISYNIRIMMWILTSAIKILYSEYSIPLKTTPPDIIPFSITQSSWNICIRNHVQCIILISIEKYAVYIINFLMNYFLLFLDLIFTAHFVFFIQYLLSAMKQLFPFI